jgi:hypothetical protein
MFKDVVLRAGQFRSMSPNVEVAYIKPYTPYCQIRTPKHQLRFDMPSVFFAMVI